MSFGIKIWYKYFPVIFYLFIWVTFLYFTYYYIWPLLLHVLKQIILHLNQTLIKNERPVRSFKNNIYRKGSGYAIFENRVNVNNFLCKKLNEFDLYKNLLKVNILGRGVKIAAAFFVTTFGTCLKKKEISERCIILGKIVISTAVTDIYINDICVEKGGLLREVLKKKKKKKWVIKCTFMF